MSSDTLRLSVDATGAVRGLDRFERRVDEALGSLNRLGQRGTADLDRVIQKVRQLEQSDYTRIISAQTRVERRMAQLSGQARRTGSAFRRFGGDVNTLGRNFRGLENAMSLSYQASTLLRAAFSFLTIREASRQIYEAAMNVERFRTAMVVASKNTGTTITQLLQNTGDIAQRTATDIHVVRDAYAKFMTAASFTNFTVEESQGLFENTAVAMRVMGKTADQQRLAFLALEQMMSKGRVQSEELRRQLGEQLPGAVQLMADAVGVTPAVLGEMMKAGEVTSEALKKFSEVLKREFGPALDAALDTPQAKLTQLTNAWRGLLEIAGSSGYMAAIKDSATDLTEALQSDEVREFAKNFGRLMGNALRAVTQAIVALLPHLDKVLILLTAITAGSVIRAITGIGGAFLGLINPLNAVGTRLLGLSGIFRVLAVLFGGLPGVVAAAVVAALGLLTYGIAQYFGLAKDDTVSWGDFIVVAIDDIASKFKALWETVTGWAGSAWGAIKGFFASGLNWIGQQFLRFASWLDGLFANFEWYKSIKGRISEFFSDVNSGSDNVGASLGGWVNGINRGARDRKMERDKTAHDKEIARAKAEKRIAELAKAEGVDLVGDSAEAGAGGGADKAAQALQQRREAAQSLFDELYPLEAAQASLAEKTELLTFANAQGLITDLQKVEALKRLNRSMADQIDPYGELISKMEEELVLAQMTNEARDFEVAKRDMILQMQEAGIDLTEQEIARWEELVRAIQKAGEVEPGFANWASNVDDFGTALGKVEEQIADEFVDALTDMAMTGKISFDQLGDSILRMMTKVMVEQITRDFLAMISNLGRAQGGSEGLLTSIAGAVFGGVAGSVATGAGTFSIGSMAGADYGSMMSVFPSGRSGGYSHALLERSRAPIAAFHHAPQYREGGVTGGIPAVLHDNEAVVPLSRGREIPVKLQNQDGGDSMANGPPIHVHFSFPNGDADSFRRSQGQIEAMAARTLDRAKQRNL